MDEKVIKEYFLSAGASYRRSSEWQKEFVDDEGNTVVRRSGRFGVGILAAFLIGKEIFVSTKKSGQQYGYRFQANLNSDQINILKDTSAPEGTSIKIKIDAKALEKLEPAYHQQYKIQWFNWYTLKRPAIEYTWFGKEMKLYKFNPDIDEALPREWYAIDSEGFNKILWTYSNKFSEYHVACNGIVIPKSDTSSYLHIPLMNRTPRLNVFDNNGFLPLSLDRNSFSDRIPFEKDLAVDVYKDFIAYVLMIDILSVPSNDTVIVADNNIRYSGFSEAYISYYAYHGFNIYEGHNESRYAMPTMLNRILVSKKGFILNYNYFIQKLGVINAIFIQANDEFVSLQNKMHLDIKDSFLFFTTDKINSIPDYSSALEPKQLNRKTGKYEELKTRVFMKKEKYEYLFHPTMKRISRWLRLNYEKEYDDKGWVSIKMGNPNPSLIPTSFLHEYSSKLNFVREYEIKCYSEGMTLFNSLLAKYIGEDAVIPFNINERQVKYSLAFQELKPYMDRYQRNSKRV